MAIPDNLKERNEMFIGTASCPTDEELTLRLLAKGVNLFYKGGKSVIVSVHDNKYFVVDRIGEKRLEKLKTVLRSKLKVD